MLHLHMYTADTLQGVEGSVSVCIYIYEVHRAKMADGVRVRVRVKERVRNVIICVGGALAHLGASCLWVCHP